MFFCLFDWDFLWSFLFCYVLYSAWRNKVILNWVIFSYICNLLYFAMSVFHFLYLQERLKGYLEQQNAHGDIIEILSTSVSGKTWLRSPAAGDYYGVKFWDCEAGPSSEFGYWCNNGTMSDGTMTEVKSTRQMNILQFFLTDKFHSLINGYTRILFKVDQIKEEE